MSGSHQFHIEKWYLDVCDENDRVLICYSLKTRWRKFEINYRGYVFADATGIIKSEHHLFNAFEPKVTEENIILNSPEVQGTWIKQLPPVNERVELPGDSEFKWMCEQPLARVKAEIRGIPMSGMGYAEKIVLNLPPWKLPIDKLYWGRFTSEKNAVVWIHWKGGHPLNFVYVNGMKYTDVKITEYEVIFPEGSVQFEALYPFRKGKLADTILKNLKVLTGVFPVKALAIEENKWAGKAILHLKRHEPIHGQCIHEMVKFA